MIWIVYEIVVWGNIVCSALLIVASFVLLLPSSAKWIEIPAAAHKEK